MASLTSSAHCRGNPGSGNRATLNKPLPETMIATAFLVILLVFGGSSEDGVGINLALELMSLLVLLMTILLAGKLRPMSGSRGLTMIAMFLLIIYAVQLVPLPPQLWSALPGRELIVRGYDLLGVPPPWRPISFNQERTLASATALLPALCALSLVLRIPREQFFVLGYSIIAVSIISVLVGITQVVGGPEANLYWHRSMEGESANGFFANPNHLSTLLLVALSLLFALAKTSFADTANRSKLSFVILTSTGLFLVFGIFASESTGGLVLLLPTLLASSFLLIKSQSPVRLSKRRAAMALLAAPIAVSIPFALIMFSNQDLSWGSSLGFGELERLGIAGTATIAAVQYFPIGAGLGTFPLVYPAHENPSRVSNFFINHAHNDYLELLFESGLLGVLLFVVIFVWWARRTITAWRAVDKFAPWAQASSIAIAIIAVHSGFDYPARAPAILALGAAFCAILGRGAPSRTASARRFRRFKIGKTLVYSVWLASNRRFISRRGRGEAG